MKMFNELAELITAIVMLVLVIAIGVSGFLLAGKIVGFAVGAYQSITPP